MGDIGKQIKDFIEKPEFDSMVKEKLEAISLTPEGAMLAMMKGMFGGNFDQLVPMMKPTLVALGKDLGSAIDVKKMVSVDVVKKEIDLLMTEKLELLTPQLVKTLIEDMIKNHLG